MLQEFASMKQHANGFGRVDIMLSFHQGKFL